jgi:hypothetical protein
MHKDSRIRPGILLAAFLLLAGPFSGRSYALSTRTLISPVGEAAGDDFGISVSGAGDMNGDGYADVIVGAPGSDAGGIDAGRAYVHFGGPDADAVPDLMLTGEAAGDGFGVSASDVHSLRATTARVGTDSMTLGGGCLREFTSCVSRTRKMRVS